MNDKLLRPSKNILKNMPFKLKKAREFAIKAHGDQKLSDGNPYIVHLDLVVNWLYSLDCISIEDDLNVFIAAYLHDTAEDTKITLNEIEDMFGAKVKDLVWRVTDEPGQNRKERKLKTYPKIKGKALAIKLADRIANVTYSNDPKFKQMYQKEQPDFEAHCRNGDYEPMWNFLNEALK